MTTTFSPTEYSDFFYSLTETVREVIAKKLALYESLSTQPDIIYRRDAIRDILTIFSMQESPVAHVGIEGNTLEANIIAYIEDYYAATGNADIVGITPAIRLQDELEDLAYTIQPRYPAELFMRYIQSQGLTAEDAMLTQKCDVKTAVIASILLVIKAQTMIMDLVELSGGSKSKRGARNDQEKGQ